MSNLAIFDIPKKVVKSSTKKWCQD
jgi:hypothetical protein